MMRLATSLGAMCALHYVGASAAMRWLIITHQRATRPEPGGKLHAHTRYTGGEAPICMCMLHVHVGTWLGVAAATLRPKLAPTSWLPLRLLLSLLLFRAYYTTRYYSVHNRY